MSKPPAYLCCVALVLLVVIPMLLIGTPASQSIESTVGGNGIEGIIAGAGDTDRANRLACAWMEC